MTKRGENEKVVGKVNKKLNVKDDDVKASKDEVICVNSRFLVSTALFAKGKRSFLAGVNGNDLTDVFRTDGRMHLKNPL